jgi:hypothetical protein
LSIVQPRACVLVFLDPSVRFDDLALPAGTQIVGEVLDLLHLHVTRTCRYANVDATIAPRRAHAKCIDVLTADEHRYNRFDVVAAITGPRYSTHA